MTNNPTDKVCTALGIIEHLQEVVQNLQVFGESLPEKYRSEFRVHLAKLEAVVAVLDTNAVHLPVLHGDAGAKLAKHATITRLGIAGELVRLRNTGKYTLEALAAQFDVPLSEVQRFFRYYDQASPSEKAKFRRQSVFDVSERLEDLLQIIIRQLARLEGLNDEVHVKYVAEFRQVISLATSLIEKVNNYQRIQQLIALVGDILVQELPERQREIIDKIYKLTQSVVSVELQPSIPQSPPQSPPHSS